MCAGATPLPKPAQTRQRVPRRTAATPLTAAKPRLSLRVGSIAGIEIRIHATFPLLVILVALGATAPEGPGLASALLWLVALFSCVVLHELAHSLVARRHGVPVLEIELLPIGGISKMERSPDNPGIELRIALAGPVASVLLGGAFAGLATLAGVPMWPPTLYGGGVLARLCWVNLLLAGFNLVPALPLDGGRVLRAVLEERTDRERATHAAARAGRLFASLMMAAGFVASLWLLVIGIFVYLGSWAEEAAATIHEHIKDLRVADMMIRSPVCAPVDAPVAQLVAALSVGAQREFPVVTKEGAYVGLVTADALLETAPERSVGAVADRAAPTLAPDDLLETSGLLDGGLSVAAVISNGCVVGLARSADAALVVRHLLHQSAPSATSRPR